MIKPRRLAWLLMALLSACAAEPPPQESSCPVCLDHLLDPPTWFPLEVVIDTKTSNHNIALFLDAIDLWNAALGQEILYATVTQDLAGMHDMCNYTTVTTNTRLPQSILGVTTSWPCSAHHVDIETMELFMGEDMASFFTDDIVKLITVHELGHVLGLPHENNDPNSVMFPILTPGSKISNESICLVRLAIALSMQEPDPQVSSL